MANVISTRICKKCGECCKQSPFVELSKDEINALEQATGLHFDLFTNSKGVSADGYFLKFQGDGACFFLNKSEDGYACGVYEARPEACKTYPSKAIQHDFCDEHAIFPNH